MPSSVIESLKKVTPPSGLLSFERFCAGLKIWLLRQRATSRVPRPVSAPDLMKEASKVVPNMATVHPVISHKRAMSVPLPDIHPINSDMNTRISGEYNVTEGPPKPPRYYSF